MSRTAKHKRTIRARKRRRKREEEALRVMDRMQGSVQYDFKKWKIDPEAIRRLANQIEKAWTGFGSVVGKLVNGIQRATVSLRGPL